MTGYRIAPPVVVAAPSATPPVHSLLKAAALHPDNDNRRWPGGVVFRPEFCGIGETWSPLCDVRIVAGEGGDVIVSESLHASGGKMDPPVFPDDVTFLPYVIDIPVECSAAGLSEAEYKGRARRAIDAVTSFNMERELWDAPTVPTNPHLADGDAFVLGAGAALKPMRALAELVAYLGACQGGGRGMIHATGDTVTVWGYQGGGIDQQGSNLVTKVNGNIVIPGGGYSGNGPPGGAARTETQAWAYATSMVQIFLTDPEVLPDTMAEALDRRTNEVVFRGERTAGAVFDLCCHAAVLVDLYA